MEGPHSPLAAWESFYVIVGSSGAALTGLQFVVMALIADVRPRTSAGQIDAFGSPTIVHFGAVLLVSAVLSAPWPTLSGAAFVLGAAGAGGLVYGALVTARARRQTGYRLVLEDWLWHIVFPLLAYAMLLVAAVALVRHPTIPLFMVAGTTILLLFVGIHNAWDTVTYLTTTYVTGGAQPASGEDDATPGAPGPGEPRDGDRA